LESKSLTVLSFPVYANDPDILAN